MSVLPNQDGSNRPSFFFFEEYQETVDPSVSVGDTCFATLLYLPPSQKGVIVAGVPLRNLSLNLETAVLMSDVRQLLAVFCWGNSALGKALKLCIADPSKLDRTILTFEIPHAKKNPLMGESELDRIFWGLSFDYDRPTVSLQIAEEIKQVSKGARRIQRDFDGSLGSCA